MASESELLEIAREAAHAGAEELRWRFGGRAQGIRSKSSPTDLVSEADLAAEDAVRRVLAARRPEDVMLAEEGGEAALARDGATTTGQAADRSIDADARLRWVVDPLDGTINFLFGIPLFAVSVACEDREGAIAGVVLGPVSDECFAASRSGPATLGGEALKRSRCTDLGQALLATGFGYEEAVRRRQAEVIGRVLPHVRDIRRAGAAALDLCWCAAGRCDAYFERGLKRWDRAAGVLIAQRAGLAVRELAARGEDEPAGVMVAPEGIIEELYELVASS